MSPIGRQTPSAAAARKPAGHGPECLPLGDKRRAPRPPGNPQATDLNVSHGRQTAADPKRRGKVAPLAIRWIWPLFGDRPAWLVLAGPYVCNPGGMNTNATASSGALPGNARQTDSYVIAVMNQKGGSGKTMVALSLAAHTVAGYGRALVVDV